MLSKCLNSHCSATFRYLWQGRLYRIDFAEASRRSAHAGGRVATARRKAELIEHFWLCESCAATMTVELGEDGEVRPVPFEIPVRKPPAGAMPTMHKLVANAS
jgi:hypothetical protein